MTDTSLQPENSVEMPEPGAGETSAPVNNSTVDVFTDTPMTEKASSKKVPKKPTTVQAVDALVETIAAMANSVSTLSNTVESLSDKVGTPHMVVDAAPRLETVSDEQIEAPRNNSLRAAALQSIGTLLSFVGVGLVAAGAMRPFDVTAIVMAIVGIVVYVLNGLLINRDAGVNSLRKYLVQAAMTVLGILGIGFLVGGIQRFGDDPHRAAVLIPLGAAFFLVVSAWKTRDRLATEHLVWMAGSGVWVCLFLAIGLGQVATHVDPKPVKAKVPHSIIKVPATVPTEMSSAETTHEAPTTTSEDAMTTSTTEVTHADSQTQQAINEAVTAADKAAAAH